jgi:hypothetical protein
MSLFVLETSQFYPNILETLYTLNLQVLYALQLGNKETLTLLQQPPVDADFKVFAA